MRYLTLDKERYDRAPRRLVSWRKLGGIILPAAILLFLLPAYAAASENPDELYKQGRFAEAEKIYSQKDMDNPKDLRYRYNRGCAAYQGGDYKGALAAFTSVSKRTEQSDVRFKAAYNLGNSAYKLEDYTSAAEFFKQAVALNPESEDAQYNLELALIKSKEKQEQEQEQKQEGQQNGQQKDQQKSQQKDDSQQGHDKQDSQDNSGQKQENQEKQKDQDQSQENQKNPDQSQEEKGQSEKQDNNQRQQQQSAPQEQSADKNKDKEPDLSGELKPREQQSSPEEMEQQQPSQAAQLDKKKAEALLDNIHEDRTRFLLRQVPPDKKRGAPSGKDW